METAKNGWHDNIIFALIVATGSGLLAAKLYFLCFGLGDKTAPFPGDTDVEESCKNLCEAILTLITDPNIKRLMDALTRY